MDTKEKKHSEIIQDEFDKAKKDADIVWRLVSSELEEPEALLNYKGNPVIFKNSTVMIQGQTGTHKSRLATSLVSLLVSKDPGLNRIPPANCVLLMFSKIVSAVIC